MQEDSGTLDSGVLRTTRAFKKQIEAQEAQEEQHTPIIFGWTILGALSLLRKSLREVCEELGPESVTLNLVEDDEFGWPRLTLRSSFGDDSLVGFVVGAQDRRAGTILSLKLNPIGMQLEMSEKDYLDTENLQRVFRLYLRHFFDQVTKRIEEQRSQESKFLHIVDAFDAPVIPEKASVRVEPDSDRIFPDKLPDPGDLAEDDLLLDADFFVEK